ncbi:MAG: GTP-binding protein [Oricola sp.]
MKSVPVHLVTGFLGAGKTTLLNRLLKSGAFANTAVIVNEFGDVGIDHLLVEAGGGDHMIELSDGCLCCTVRSDLVDTLRRLAARIDDGAAIDRVIVETTGLADPVPVLQAVIAAPAINERFHVAGVITVVCAATGLASLEDHEEARRQAALADRIVLTKTDLAEPPGELYEALAALNPLAAPADAGTADFLLTLLDDSARTAAQVPAADAHGHHHHHHDVNRHDAAIEAFTLTHDRPIPLASVEMFCDLLRSSMASGLLRMKGIVQTAEDRDRPLVIHGVRTVFHPPLRLDGWDGRTPETRLVVIARNGSRAHVEGLFAAFTGGIAPDRPDAQALTDNPLAIPGF